MDAKSSWRQRFCYLKMNYLPLCVPKNLLIDITLDTLKMWFLLAMAFQYSIHSLQNPNHLNTYRLEVRTKIDEWWSILIKLAQELLRNTSTFLLHSTLMFMKTLGKMYTFCPPPTSSFSFTSHLVCLVHTHVEAYIYMMLMLMRDEC